MAYKKHVISENQTVKSALIMLDALAYDAILFTINNSGVLTGSVTDGDVRRGFVKGITIEDPVKKVSYKSPRSFLIDNVDINQLVEFREAKIGIVPIVDSQNRIIDVINFRLRKSLLPIDVVIMAGGKGMRLRPLTETIPKPLLMVGDKTILEHNMRRHESYGVQSIHITTNYLSEKIDEFVSEIGHSFRTKIKTVKEEDFLGTIGAVGLIKEFNQDYVLVSNSDLLTDVDYEAFFLDFIKNDADMSVVSIPYSVDIPYAIMDIEENYLQSFHEKPRYTYFSNGGIYLLKKEVLNNIPVNQPYSATDLMQKLISDKRKIRTFAHKGYWLDIGQHQDYNKAQEDIKRKQF
ncbi:MAG: sugar phosphate nucleotidyltransferase [Crocinitomicaceae bacterium]|jgi:dTDP-glucose pyrophosphorylase|tara:strand:- start:35472 stop:36518 length:1047 start_codon:yes stop_codon:yes gene_type:complete